MMDWHQVKQQKVINDVHSCISLLERSTVDRSSDEIQQQTFLLFHRFPFFTWCQPIIVNRLNYFHWLAKPSGARIMRADPFFTAWRVNKLNWRCLNSNHNLVEFLYLIATLPLIHCSYVLYGEMRLERSTNLACWPFNWGRRSKK